MRAAAAALAVALALFSGAGAADEGWRAEKDQDGIRVSTRAAPGWSIREFRGETRINARLATLVAVLDDLSALHEINDLVIEARELGRDSPQRYRYYTVTHLPWPLSNRDLINQREIRQDPASLAVSITDVALAGAMPPQKGRVRIARSQQTWELAPAGGGAVAVSVRVLADPNGPIPSSLINSMSIDVPFKTLSRVKALAQRPQYAGARLPFIHEPGAPGAASTP